MKFSLVWLFISVLVATGAQAEEFERALPGRTFSFPRDHYSHPEFRTEWWYYTGHVRSQDGRSFGYQLTFFRTGLRRERPSQSKWAVKSLYFAHFAITNEGEKGFTFREKISRGALGQAGAATDRLHVWVEDWILKGDGADHLLEARDASMAIRFRLTPLKRPVFNGINGISQKAEGVGNASHYYSMTRMKTTGDLTIKEKVLTVEGISWMDHEFGTNQLQSYQVGWDWFSIQMENNTELMLYIIRHKDGSPDPCSSGTLIYPDGTARHIRLNEFDIRVLETWKSRKTGAGYPARWNIRLPELGIDLTVTPSVADQELTTQESTRVTYWEGSVRVEGRFGSNPVSGVGYVELTGYAQPLAGRI